MRNLFGKKRTRDLSRLESLSASSEAGRETLSDESCQKEFTRKLSFRPASLLGKRQERLILAELPILLESLILLVESGLGILPAIHKLLESSNKETKSQDARYYLGKVHQLSVRGLPFVEALEKVAEECPFPALRHFFLHLDIGANVGGKLGSSLRSLAQHSHQEWRLSVEARVRRLENLVVFPVFGSVVGLILLTASVPLIPLLELRDKLDQAQSREGVPNQHLEETNP